MIYQFIEVLYRIYSLLLSSMMIQFKPVLRSFVQETYHPAGKNTFIFVDKIELVVVVVVLDEISEFSLGSVHRGDFSDMLGGTSVLCLMI